MEDNKPKIQDINREFYDFRYDEKEKDFFRIESGLTPEIVRKLSEEKGDPEWMKDFRLKSLEIYNKLGVSTDWMPNIDNLHMEDIATYVRPKTKMSGDWKDVPKDIKVIGFDDIAFAKHFTPSLTTIKQNRKLLGQVAAKNLIAQIEGNISLKESIERVPVELVIRESTKCYY